MEQLKILTRLLPTIEIYLLMQFWPNTVLGIFQLNKLLGST